MMINEFSKVLSLPKHLQTSFMALCSIGRATATMVSAVTKRTRAMESSNLNTLALLGYAAKDKDGHIKYFAPNQQFEAVIKEVSLLSSDERHILAEDMATAFENRLKVFRKVKSKW